jgi:hypothetical protein
MGSKLKPSARDASRTHCLDRSSIDRESSAVLSRLDCDRIAAGLHQAMKIRRSKLTRSHISRPDKERPGSLWGERPGSNRSWDGNPGVGRCGFVFLKWRSQRRVQFKPRLLNRPLRKPRRGAELVGVAGAGAESAVIVSV